MNYIRVIDHLTQLGFKKDESGDNFRFNYGGINIKGSELLAYIKWLDCIRFTGSFTSDFKTDIIEFTLPIMVESLDYLKAILAHHIDSFTHYYKADEPLWLSEGRANSKLLFMPSGLLSRQFIANNIGEYCVISCDRLEHAIDILTDALDRASNDSIVKFGFNGSSFQIQFYTSSEVFIIPATGKAWSQWYCVRSAELRLVQLPKPIPVDIVTVGEWNKQFRIGYSLYPLVNESGAPQTPHEDNTNECKCLCMDADTAYNTIHKQCKLTHTLRDTSHFDVNILRCECCGQRFLSIFFELIDWEGGNDSQAWKYIPVSEKEAQHLIDLKRRVCDQDISDMHLNRRHLVESYPKDGSHYRFWATKEQSILYPHDF